MRGSGRRGLGCDRASEGDEVSASSLSKSSEEFLRNSRVNIFFARDMFYAEIHPNKTIRRRVVGGAENKDERK